MFIIVLLETIHDREQLDKVLKTSFVRSFISGACSCVWLFVLSFFYKKKNQLLMKPVRHVEPINFYFLLILDIISLCRLTISIAGPEVKLTCLCTRRFGTRFLLRRKK